MKRSTICLLLLLSYSNSLLSQKALSGRGFLVSTGANAGGAGPYLSFGGSFMGKYEFRSLQKGIVVAFPSVGVGILGIGYGHGLIAPIEYNMGIDFKYLGLYTSVGVIANTEGALLHPALLPTLRGVTRFKMPKSRFFIDLEYRIIKHYIYSGAGDSEFEEPFYRVGWGQSFGCGISVGRYLDRGKEE